MQDEEINTQKSWSDNADKSKRGKIRMGMLADKFESLKENGKIKGFEKQKRYTMKGYSKDQFYAPFEIEFEDGSKWEVFSSTSYKSDREKGNQWDAFNIKKIEYSVERCYLVIFPNDKKNRDEISNENQKLQKKLSYIDAIIDDSEFFDLLEEKSYESRGRTAGQIHDERGRSFEGRVADVLSAPGNLQKWLGNKLQSGLDYEFLFRPIMENFSINKNTVESINATTDIPNLPSGGSPKTDIAVVIELTDGSSVLKPISCKSSSKNWVSVHQYPFEAFIDVLDIDDSALIQSLAHLQECGGPLILEKEYRDEYKYLCSKLPMYNIELARWVLGGFGGVSNRPEIQNAEYLLVRNEANNQIQLYPIEDYIEGVMLNSPGGQLGTPFKWTYASGRKGKSIQLKCRIS